MHLCLREKMGLIAKCKMVSIMKVFHNGGKQFLGTDYR